jgi:hypothetical protein
MAFSSSVSRIYSPTTQVDRISGAHLATSERTRLARTRVEEEAIGAASAAPKRKVVTEERPLASIIDYRIKSKLGL